jgi:hypothetical protein
MFLKFNDTEEFLQASVYIQGFNRVYVQTDTEPNTSGFVAYLRDNTDYPLADYSEYTTLYRVVEDGYLLSSDGSVYSETEESSTDELTDEEKAQKEREKRIVELQMDIENLKEQLSQTDYQIIKAYEYSLVGKEVDYDIEALHESRQAIRDEINALESEMYELINEHLEATGV